MAMCGLFLKKKKIVFGETDLQIFWIYILINFRSLYLSSKTHRDSTPCGRRFEQLVGTAFTGADKQKKGSLNQEQTKVAFKVRHHCCSLPYLAFYSAHHVEVQITDFQNSSEYSRFFLPKFIMLQ